jgi:IMP cyclohydrolase
MQARSLAKELSSTSYPGRGIILGKSADEKCFAVGYFIMGRSQNSRNRIFVPTSDGIVTKAFDESKMVDPSLIIYSPVKTLNGLTIVSNGDQTHTIYEFLKAGKTFEEALKTRTFEPDAPNYTPRISGIADPKNDRILLSIIKTDGGDPTTTLRFFYEYNSVQNGTGYYIHTYKRDGNPLPSFEGDPVKVMIGNDITSFTEEIWSSLDSGNKISLFTCFIPLETSNTETRIINKNV